MIQTKPDDNGVLRGSGKDYHYYQCSRCKELVSSHYDPGRWSSVSVAVCSACAGEVKAVQRSCDRRTRPVELSVPGGYVMASYAGFSADVVARMNRWPKRSPFLGLYGPAGRGKTWAAWGTAKRLAADGLRVLVLDCDRAKGAWASREAYDREALIDYWRGVAYLILEDISRPVASEGWASAFAGLLEVRWAEQRPTMLTSMDGGAELEKLFGEVVRSRLSVYDWVVLRGPDRRRKTK